MILIEWLWRLSIPLRCRLWTCSQREWTHIYRMQLISYLDRFHLHFRYQRDFMLILLFSKYQILQIKSHIKLWTEHFHSKICLQSIQVTVCMKFQNTLKMVNLCSSFSVNTHFRLYSGLFTREVCWILLSVIAQHN